MEDRGVLAQRHSLPLPPKFGRQSTPSVHHLVDLTKSEPDAAPLASASAPVAAPPAAKAGGPAGSAVEATGASPSKPSQSFDGRQSFISLDVDERPVTGVPAVDQPPPSSSSPALVAPFPPKSPPPRSNAASSSAPAAHPPQHAQRADPLNAGTAKQHKPKQPKQPSSAEASTTSAAATAAEEADRQGITPDLFAGASKERPSSAANQGLTAFESGEADAGQKLLVASKSKAAGKGNIQIVLATKHKQVGAPAAHKSHCLESPGEVGCGCCGVDYSTGLCWLPMASGMIYLW